MGAPRLEAGALMQALERGDFYASTGVVLDEVTATERSLAVKVKIEGVSKYRVQFIGRGGQILSEVGEPTASYAFKGDEGYVRAKVIESNGRIAWVQPGLGIESHVISGIGMGGADPDCGVGGFPCT